MVNQPGENDWPNNIESPVARAAIKGMGLGFRALDAVMSTRPAQMALKMIGYPPAPTEVEIWAALDDEKFRTALRLARLIDETRTTVGVTPLDIDSRRTRELFFEPGYSRVIRVLRELKNHGLIEKILSDDPEFNPDQDTDDPALSRERLARRNRAGRRGTGYRKSTIMNEKRAKLDAAIAGLL